MKDFTGKELKIGQVVICITGKYKEFKVGIVTNITSYMVLVDFGFKSTRIFPSQTIIADKVTLKYKLGGFNGR